MTHLGSVKWPTTKVGRLFDVLGGTTPSADESNWSGPVTWVTPVDLRPVHGGWVSESGRTLSEAGASSAGLVPLPAGSIVLSCRAPIGYVAVSTVPVTTNQGCKTLVATSDIDARYFRYQFEVFRDVLEVRGRGSTFNEVSSQAVADFPVVAPPLGTQRRVSDMLDAETARIDTLIQKNERVIELVWLRFRIDRLHRISGGYLIGSDLARDWFASQRWPVAPLWLVSQNHDSRRIPLNAEERGARQGPYPYWGANSIQDHIDGWLFEGPHVLIGEDGAPFFIDERDVAWVADGRYWVNNHAHVLESVSVNPWWLAECLNVTDYSLFVSGSTRDKLTQESLNRIPVPLPPVDEQERILRELQRARELAAAIVSRCRRQQELLRLRRQALVTAAVTGQIEV